MINIAKSSQLPERIFIHFLDYEIFHGFGLDKLPQSKVLEEFFLAFRFALLITDTNVVIPASHYFESEMARQIIELHRSFAEYGFIDLAAATLDIPEFLDKKQQQYFNERERHARYFDPHLNEAHIKSRARWIIKLSDTTRDIAADWEAGINDSSRWGKMYSIQRLKQKPSEFERQIESVPENLGNRAFISDYVLPLLSIDTSPKNVSLYINAIIQRAYINSYLSNYNAVCISDFTIFDSTLLMPSSRWFSFTRAKRHLHQKGLLQFILTADSPTLLNFRLSNDWQLMRVALCAETFVETESSSDIPQGSNNSSDATSNVNTEISAIVPASGRPHLPDDIWAWREIHEAGRLPKEVFEEWLDRTGVKARQLQDPIRHFRKIQKFDWFRPTGD